MITLRVDEGILKSVLEVALGAPNLTATERWNIAVVSNVAKRAIAEKASTEEIEGVPIP